MHHNVLVTRPFLYHRYPIEVDLALCQFKSVKLKDKNILKVQQVFHNLIKKRLMGHDEIRSKIGRQKQALTGWKSAVDQSRQIEQRL